MQGIQIYKKLAWLNELPPDEAEYVLLECSGSADWARVVTAARPYPMLDQLFVRGEHDWHELTGQLSGDGWDLVKQRLERLLER